MIEIQQVSKAYRDKKQEFWALKNISLTIEQGDIFGIVGVSGAGKSTLVRCLNLLERPTEGQVLMDGQDITSLSLRELNAKRREIGMIFQHFHLLQQRTVAQNIAFPLEIAHVQKPAIEERVAELLNYIGLTDRAHSYPGQLSGGMQQRVAIARALANHPKILLCDEATSALDTMTSYHILQLLQKINRQMGITIVFITHEMGAVSFLCNKVAVLHDAELAEQGLVEEVFGNPQSEVTRQILALRGIKS